MFITIIAEPRSGSTNLGNWFFHEKDFTVLFEPITNPSLKWFKYGESPNLWEYKTKHLLVKEIYQPNINFSELIKVSEKIIVLYRENIIEQTQSWLNAKKTNNWSKQWAFNHDLIKNDDTQFFTNLKNEFKKNYLDSEYFKISYEDLYYNNAFQKVIDYLDVNGLTNKNFPLGQKYRINANKTKKLI